MPPADPAAADPAVRWYEAPGVLCGHQEAWELYSWEGVCSPVGCGAKRKGQHRNLCPCPARACLRPSSMGTSPFSAWFHGTVPPTGWYLGPLGIQLGLTALMEHMLCAQLGALTEADFGFLFGEVSLLGPQVWEVTLCGLRGSALERDWQPWRLTDLW